MLGNWIRNFVARQVVAGFRDGVERVCGPAGAPVDGENAFLEVVDQAETLALPARLETVQARPARRR
jgi:hypothetical protein